MASSRAVSCWRSTVNRIGRTTRDFSTPSTPRSAAHASQIPDFPGPPPAKARRRWVRGEFAPVYVAVGLILLAATIGIHTAKQQLAHSPNVCVSKKRRESVPEVDDPGAVAGDSHRFAKGSFFRRVATAQETPTAPAHRTP